MRDAAWNNERLDVLKMLWARGETATAIGATLGLSRSAVLGQIFRLRRGPVAAGQRRDTQISKNAPAVARRRVPRRDLPEVKPSTTGKSLLELTNDCCRWPYRRPGTEKYFFCGAAGADLEGGIPYCPRHMRRAYVVEPDVAVQARREAAQAARRAKRASRS